MNGKRTLKTRAVCEVGKKTVTIYGRWYNGTEPDGDWFLRYLYTVDECEIDISECCMMRTKQDGETCCKAN